MDDLRAARGIVNAVGLALAGLVVSLGLHACVAHAQPQPPPGIRTLAPATTNSLQTTPTPTCSAAGGGACLIDIKIGPRLLATATTAPVISDAGSGAFPNIASLPNGTTLMVGGADGVTTRLTLNAFGGGTQVTGIATAGTRAAPSALGLGSSILNMSGQGYGATGYAAGSRISLSMQTAEMWTDTAQGTMITVVGTPTGSIVPANWARWVNGHYLVGTITDCGATLCVTGTSSFTGAARGVPVSLTISTATFTPNFDTAQNFTMTLVHASCPCTLANPSTTLVGGQSGIIAIHQSATGSDTIGTWGSEYVAVGGTAAITLSTGANARDYIPYYVSADATQIVLGSVIKAPTH